MSAFKLCLFLFLVPAGFPLMSLAQTSQSDTGFINHATAVLNQQTASRPVEKVYLHSDKSYYTAGDDIWFKAYLTSGGLHLPSTISGLLNVELISVKDKKIVQAIKLQVASGITAGDFHLPNTLPAGLYHIRAYTNYMLNTGSNYFFEQELPIGNTMLKTTNINSDIKIIIPTQKDAPTTLAELANVQFLPESGILINSINSAVAFKAIGPGGRGMVVSGVLNDDTGAEITRFHSFHLGMGSFNLYPEAGKSYKAILTFADSSHKIVSLPVAYNQGYSLKLNNQTDNAELGIRISYNGGMGKHSITDSTLFLVGQSGGYMCYAAKIILRGNITGGRIPKAKFPTGIAQFTLFTASGEPLCERVAFINNHDQLSIEIENNKPNKVKQETKLNLHVKDATGNPVMGGFSAAVIDDEVAPDNELNESDNIISYLFLTSDLKGKVELPGYYFKDENDSTRIALDLLMLTQGYRRFEWKAAFANQLPPVAYLPERGLTFSGRLTTPGDKPIAHGNITLFNKANSFLLDTVSNDQGVFNFHNLMFKDSVRFLLTAKTEKGGDDVRIHLDNNQSTLFSPDIDTIAKFKNYYVTERDTLSIPASYQQNSTRKYHLSTTENVLLKEVKVRSSSTKTLVSSYSANLNGPGNADQVLTSKELENQGGDLGTVLIGKLSGIKVANGKLISSRSGSGVAGGRAMLVVIDGNYLSSDLSIINPSDVESIEVLKSAAYTAVYGSRGGNGVVVITTKHGGNRPYESPSNVMAVTLPGFYKGRVFYEPNYNDSKTNASVADTRTTIYWNPGLVTDKDGNVSFSYFNAGTKSTYRVIVQGFDGTGKLGFRVVKFAVD